LHTTEPTAAAGLDLSADATAKVQDKKLLDEKLRAKVQEFQASRKTSQAGENEGGWSTAGAANQRTSPGRAETRASSRRLSLVTFLEPKQRWMHITPAETPAR